MADAENKRPTETDDQKRLKYLDFVQVAVIYSVVCFSTLYDYAKESSGPLKSGVHAIEGTVKTVIGPVYERFHDVPFDLLMFVDRKVDESMREVDRHVPSLVKQASSQALTVAHKAPEVARAVASKMQRAGVVDTAKSITRTAYTKCEPTAKELYASYEPVAEKYAVTAWRSLNRLPMFPQVAQIAIPTAGYWTDKYNQAVCYSAERGYAVAEYLPLIPKEKIAKVFEETDGGPGPSANGEVVDVAQ
ncbi:stress-related protein-like isoform X2 [Corylus avellana]|uniref:stress-related protein-like isoform X2 n=1 Tax=Corylus avellana TaxID=13451 RepID=UPI00286B7BA3|nr:stress-related protein-like isoform X2 [Corylus avellana]